jgi:hypothetical protein
MSKRQINLPTPGARLRSQTKAQPFGVRERVGSVGRARVGATYTAVLQIQ